MASEFERGVMATDPYSQFIQEYAAEIEIKATKTSVSVMVLGPSLESTTPGAELRKRIISECEQHGVAIKGEHHELSAEYQRVIKRGGSACTMELVAAKQVDAVVIIPDSVGSFVELGLFALHKDVCSKTMMLLDETYANSSEPSFLKLGPQVSFEAKGATIKAVNYSQQDIVWDMVDQFIWRFRSDKFDREMMR